MDRQSRTGVLGASSEEKSDDTIADPHDGAEQRQPHITGAPVSRQGGFPNPNCSS